jgi:hypothetical protein
MTLVLLTVFILALTFSNSFAAAKLSNFNEIISALKSGEKVRVIFYYAKCQLISDNEIKSKSPDAVGGMNIDTFEYFAKNSVKNPLAFVVASESKLIANPVGDGYVYNYVKVKISEDGRIRITARYLDAKTFEVVMDESFYTSVNEKDSGAKFYIVK